jgi:hypothetical protein
MKTVYFCTFEAHHCLARLDNLLRMRYRIVRFSVIPLSNGRTLYSVMAKGSFRWN